MARVINKIKFVVVMIGLLFTCIVNAAEKKSVIDVIKSVEEQMSKINVLSADFLQIRKMSLLNYDMKLQGNIYLQKPDAFAWHTTKPLVSSTVVKDGVFKQWDEDSGETLKFNVDGNPAFQIIWKQMSTWFSGKYTSFIVDYNIKVLSESPLSLEFIPKPKTLAEKKIKSVSVYFNLEQSYIQSILISEKQGDTSEIKFTNIVLNKKLDEKVWNVKLNAHD